MTKVNILGVDFFHTTFNEFTLNIKQRIMDDKKTFIVTANPEIVMYAKKSKSYQEILDAADFVTADGIGIVKASAALGHALPERVTGYDLMLNLLDFAHSEGLKVYLLGAQPDVLFKTVEQVESKYPGAQVVGYHHGFFNEEDQTIVNSIKSLEPDIVFVALGVPRQEQWIYNNVSQFKKGLFIGIGGSFDVLAGKAKRAPYIWQKLNIEWLYRLLKNPSRWKRMLVLPKFALEIYRKKFFR